jgi:F0F1-type ATP synthase delta subunit
VLHISFSADPSVSFLEKLMAWLRKEIHPLVLVTVGLQPSIGAGCIIRSTNKQFDLSLRQDFKKKQDMLRDKILEATVPEPTAEPQGIPV